MYLVEIRRSFSAAHQLRGYNGDCKNLHGHNYGIVAAIACDKLNEIGIALDFKQLKAAVDEVINQYDHKNLSELADFAEINPTSEVLARTIYGKLSALLNAPGIKVKSIRVEESDSSALTYFED